MKPVSQWPEHYRQPLKHGIYASDPGDDFGVFRMKVHGAAITMIVSAGHDAEATGEEGHWEHVSVSLADRCPTWAEMCKVKDLFWGPEECVVQFHPSASDYVNQHPFCLHLWKWRRGAFPQPPSICVGIVNAPKTPLSV